MDTARNKLPPDLKAGLDAIDKNFLEKSRERYNAESKTNSATLEQLNKSSFELRKDLIVLVGTMFGSSIALATGRDVDIFFTLGEVSLFTSLIAGLVILNTNIKAKEWDYYFQSKMSIDSYLLMSKEKMDQFELKIISKLRSDYEKLIKKNQSGIMYSILRIVPIDAWPIVFDLAFLCGVTLILISIMPI